MKKKFVRIDENIFKLQEDPNNGHGHGRTAYASLEDSMNNLQEVMVQFVLRCGQTQSDELAKKGSQLIDALSTALSQLAGLQK